MKDESNPFHTFNARAGYARVVCVGDTVKAYWGVGGRRPHPAFLDPFLSNRCWVSVAFRDGVEEFKTWWDCPGRAVPHECRDVHAEEPFAVGFVRSVS